MVALSCSPTLASFQCSGALGRSRSRLAALERIRHRTVPNGRGRWRLTLPSGDGFWLHTIQRRPGFAIARRKGS